MCIGDRGLGLGGIPGCLPHQAGHLVHRRSGFLKAGGLLFVAAGKVIRSRADLAGAYLDAAGRGIDLLHHRGQPVDRAVEALPQWFVVGGKRISHTVGEVTLGQPVQRHAKRPDDLFLPGGILALGLAGLAEHLDGAGHRANLVIAVDMGAAGFKIARCHAGHNLGYFRQRRNHAAAQQDQGRLQANKNQQPGNHQQGNGPAEGGAGISGKPLLGAGGIGNQRIDRFAVIAVDRFKLGIGGIGPGHIAAACGGNQALVDKLPEAGAIPACGGSKRGLQLIIKGAGLPISCAFVELALKPFQVGNVLGGIFGLISQQARLEVGLQQIHRRRQDIGVEVRNLLVSLVDWPANADLVDGIGGEQCHHRQQHPKCDAPDAAELPYCHEPEVPPWRSICPGFRPGMDPYDPG